MTEEEAEAAMLTALAAAYSVAFAMAKGQIVEHAWCFAQARLFIEEAKRQIPGFPP